MRKICHQSQLKLSLVRQKGINPDELVKKYGIRFVCKLINYLTKEKGVKYLTRSAIYPQIKKFDWRNEEQIEQYFDFLEDAGFKIKTKPEDFIDEDTGQIVTLQRRYFYYLKK
ncbi:MAG: hypothetical protein WAW11_01195 [Patescibacteria group bacterium]